MTKVLIIPVVALLLLAGACAEDSDPTTVDTRAQVRFFNVVWNANGPIGFTTNGQFATGSALAYGQSSQTCTGVDAGNTSFGIGAANSAGTAITGAALASLINQNIADGGNYTVLAGGNVGHPSVVLLNNSVSGTVGANQAAVRFVNLAAAAEFPFTVLKGTAGSGTTVQTDLTFRSATPFSTVTSGSNEYSIMSNQQAVISGSAATLNLQGGTINTIAIVRNPATQAFQLVSIPAC